MGFQLELIRTGHKLKSPQDLKAAMEGLEIGAQIAINIRDLMMFDRIMIQLKQYYLISDIGKLSQCRQHLTGLYLMYLLTENRFGDFHVEIELLSFEDLDNKFIKFPMMIEQFMMEGSYGKIIEAKNNLPDKTYNALLSKLEGTVKKEISLSLQAVHDEIPLKDGLEMLSLRDVKALQQFVQQNELKWTVDGKLIHFAPTEQKQQGIDAVTTAQDMLQFTSNI